MVINEKPIQIIGFTGLAIYSTMAFQIEDFIRLRPFLYHLTFCESFPPILSSGTLYPASRLLKMSGCAPEKGPRRTRHEEIPIKKWKVRLRDQIPLAQGHIEWEAGWNLDRFVHHLNDHVFFWPGNETEPINMGRNHFDRYASENPALIRVDSRALLLRAGNYQPLFSICNSGAPRSSGGKKQPRGSKTFLSASEISCRPSQVKEVAFRHPVALPMGFSYRLLGVGSWKLHYWSDAIMDGVPVFPDDEPWEAKNGPFFPFSLRDMGLDFEDTKK